MCKLIIFSIPSKIAIGLCKAIQQINPEVNSSFKKKTGEFIE